MSTQQKLDEILQLTRTLGEPHREYVIIGEGNTSCRIDDNAFYIKASGQQMENITADGFVAVHFEPVLALLDNPPDTYSETKRISNEARVDPSVSVVPSVEVTFHAMLLHECQVDWVGHTHPVAVNKLLCSNRAEAFAKNRTCPDEAVVCGPESVFVPYEDPGLPLAIVMRDKVREYMDAYGAAPKVILLKNHGLIALGQSPTEVRNITAMCVKGAHILAGAYQVGEPVFLSREVIMHITNRPDEIYRRSQFI